MRNNKTVVKAAVRYEKKAINHYFQVLVGLAIDGLFLFCYYADKTNGLLEVRPTNNPTDTWGAKRPKHREPQRPLRLQHLRQERQADQWRIHRPRRGQALDGGAGEESRLR